MRTHKNAIKLEGMRGMKVQIGFFVAAQCSNVAKKLTNVLDILHFDDKKFIFLHIIRILRILKNLSAFARKTQICKYIHFPSKCIF